MAEPLEQSCKALIARREYTKCEKQIRKAMEEEPHSPIPHNLMGILMEKLSNHALAMKHFRAAAALDPTYIPARFNMEQYGTQNHENLCAFCEEDCPVEQDSQFSAVWDRQHHIHLMHQ